MNPVHLPLRIATAVSLHRTQDLWPAQPLAVAEVEHLAVILAGDGGDEGGNLRLYTLGGYELALVFPAEVCKRDESRVSVRAAPAGGERICRGDALYLRGEPFYLAAERAGIDMRP